MLWGGKPSDGGWPDEHRQHTNTVMDVIPLATKVLGRVGEGITHTLTGVYVLLTGVDESGRQVCNFGASDGILEEKIAWGRAGDVHSRSMCQS